LQNIFETAESCVLCCFNSEFTNKINKITNKTNKMTKIFAFLLVLYVILMILFVKSLLKQQRTQLPDMKAVISHENFWLCRAW
jgi:energy-converting hydrogenase Eha subunit F